jgi:actin related protein 2/3 complex subunit 1A/1B
LLAFTGHDCSLNIVDSETNSLQNIRCNGLPFTTIKFLSETKLVSAGHDFVPSLFESDAQGTWKFVKTLDMGNQKKAASSGLAANSAFNKFRQMDTLGKKEDQPEESQLNTTHFNTIK